MFWEQEAAGSNPATPTNKSQTVCLAFLFSDIESLLSNAQENKKVTKAKLLAFVAHRPLFRITAPETSGAVILLFILYPGFCCAPTPPLQVQRCRYFGSGYPATPTESF